VDKTASISTTIDEFLQNRDDRHRSLVEYPYNLVFIYSEKAKLLSIGVIPAQILGYTCNEIVNVSMKEFIPAEVHREFDNY
jgi:hypothetical protein